MPYARPSLTSLRTQVLQQLAAALQGADPLLRFSNLGILGQVQAGLAHLHFGYLDWIAQQCNPFTATEEFLEAWAALKGVIRIAAAQAVGSVTFTGTDGVVLPAGSAIVRGDGVTYTTTASGTVAGGSVTVPIIATADPAGLTGAFGNCSVGTVMSRAASVAGLALSGVVSAAVTGGADLEADDSLRSRMLARYRAPAHGGSQSDYVTWAREVPGVTRAWCVPHGYGAGTVLVYCMLDEAQVAHGGFPQGTNGTATGETRAAHATGDQLAVANHILPLQPVTALVYSLAPAANVVPFTIAGLSGASAGVKAAIAAAIAETLAEYGAVGPSTTTVLLSYIEAVIGAVPGSTGFVVTAPAGNIVSPAGALPVLGTITWAP